MPIDLDQKYEIIYAHEEQFAYALAGRVVKKPEASVWMILIPILFIHHAYKINQYKEGVKSFAKGILAAKKKSPGQGIPGCFIRPGDFIRAGGLLSGC